MSNNRVIVLNNNCLKHLFTKIRDAKTAQVEWRLYSKRLMNILCEEGLSYVNPVAHDIVTPTNASFSGESVNPANIVAISIIRAGDALLDSFMEIAPLATVGKILIQRNEETKQPMLYYSKLPSLVGKDIVLCDPMLATGGSAACAIKVLLDNGAEESKIVFINVLACPQGIDMLMRSYPKIRIVTACVDSGLNEKAYIVPGLGDYGDRYFGTV